MVTKTILKTGSCPASTEPRVEAEFNVDHLAMGLKGRSARGAVLTLFSQSFRLLLQFGSSAALARLVTPGDYGLIGMVSAVIGILTVFGNFGLSSAIVQRRDINHRQVSALFWLNAALGLALALLTAAISPGLAWFYHDRRLIPVTAALGLGFFLGGLGVQHNALLRRQMRFGALSAIEIVAGTVAALTGVLLAWLRFGYWALVMMQLTATLAASVGAWSMCRWVPGRPQRGADIRSMFFFGSNLTIFGFLNFLARNLDNVLIGRRWGAEELGQYARSYNLLLLPLTQINVPISNVVVPAMSRLQDDPVTFRKYYLKGINLVAYSTMPLILVLGICSEDIVNLVLGPQWSHAAKLFKLLAIAAFLQPVANTTGWLYTALNRTHEMARWGLISSPLFVASFLIGLPWGTSGVAISYATVSWLLTWPCFALGVRGTPVSLRDVVLATYRPLIVASVFGITLLTCRTALAGRQATSVLTLSAIALALVVLLMVSFWTTFRNDLTDIVKSLRFVPLK